MLTKFKKKIGEWNKKALNFIFNPLEWVKNIINPAKKKLSIKYKIIDNKLIIDLNFYLYKYDLLWKSVSLSFYKRGSVKSHRDSIKEKILYRKGFIINWQSKTITFDLWKTKAYTYDLNGSYIDTKLLLVATIDDKIIFDTEIEEPVLRKLRWKPSYISGAEKILNPKDNYNFLESFLALNSLNRFLMWWFLILYIFIFLYYAIINPNAAFFIGLLSILIIFWLKKVLGGYINFRFKNKPFTTDIDKVYKLSEIVSWKSWSDMYNTRIRVVAANIERWTYVEWSWKHKRTVRVTKSTNWIIILDEKIPFIPKNRDISDYLRWSFTFKDMYKKLFPPLKITSNHWIDVEWEIQLINNELIDKEIKWPTNFMKYDNFINK